MEIKQQIKKVLQEAEIYRSQGLITEAQAKYLNAAKLISSIQKLKNKENLLATIQEKIRALSSSKEKVDNGSSTPELSKKAQDLIKNLFAFSDNKDADAAALEGAVALAKFGQFDRALKELHELLKKEHVRVDAAKNILRCHLASSSVEEAVDQYHKWFSGNLFPAHQLAAVRTYLEEILSKKGVEVTLPSAKAPPQAKKAQSDSEKKLTPETPIEPEEEFIDITSIGITMESGPRKGKMVEFDVNFQSGNMLSLIIPRKDQDLIDELAQGMKLQGVQFFSPIAIFNGVGTVAAKTQIKTGPKQGDFCLDIRISSS